MKYFQVFTLCVFLTSCGGSLSEEQRQAMKEKMELNEIRIISDGQITEAAFAYGRHVMNALTKGSIDSVGQTYHVKIVELRPEDSALSSTESQIVVAYFSISDQSDLADNVQKIGSDSLLYTMPITKDGDSLILSHILGIRIPKKQVVLSIKD